jgi:hypothetical protein
MICHYSNRFCGGHEINLFQTPARGFIFIYKAILAFCCDQESTCSLCVSRQLASAVHSMALKDEPMSTFTAPPTSRVVLEGVPRIGYDVHLCPFPGSLYAWLQYTGNPTSFDFLMGTTGAAFRRTFNRDDGGNIDLSYFGEEPYKRVFAALGYRFHFVPFDRPAMRAAITQNIDQGKPVIAFGIVGPPEAGLITGYAEAGDVVYGWNHFQEGRDRYYEKRGWFEGMDYKPWMGLVVIDEQLPARPTDRETLVASLQWALELEQTERWPHLPNHICGLAASDAWADALEVDADYPPANDEVMATRCMVYGDQVTMIEERNNAANFLRQMSHAAPEATDVLNAAADAYQAVGGYGRTLWPWGFTSHMDARAGLADPSKRRELAAHIRAARAKEAEAIALLEKAVAKLG